MSQAYNQRLDERQVKAMPLSPVQLGGGLGSKSGHIPPQQLPEQRGSYKGRVI
jgi:hypothetical protein